jgi:two-component sensor histidine kinase
VKNNLQIVTSLLNLRAQRLQSPIARDAVRQAQMRIGALALVHRNLYENDDIQEIELQDFLTVLVTEAVSNAFKHAFHPDQSGQIDLKLSHHGAQAHLVIADDGVGLAGSDAMSGGMGVTLMHMLAKQLGGSLAVVEADGTRLELDFPLRRSGLHEAPSAASTTSAAA